MAEHRRDGTAAGGHAPHALPLHRRRPAPRVPLRPGHPAQGVRGGRVHRALPHPARAPWTAPSWAHGPPPVPPGAQIRAARTRRPPRPATRRRSARRARCRTVATSPTATSSPRMAVPPHQREQDLGCAPPPGPPAPPAGWCPGRTVPAAGSDAAHLQRGDGVDGGPHVAVPAAHLDHVGAHQRERAGDAVTRHQLQRDIPSQGRGQRPGQGRLVGQTLADPALPAPGLRLQVDLRTSASEASGPRPANPPSGPSVFTGTLCQT